jgi:hypothetical protein
MGERDERAGVMRNEESEGEYGKGYEGDGMMLEGALDAYEQLP